MENFSVELTGEQPICHEREVTELCALRKQKDAESTKDAVDRLLGIAASSDPGRLQAKHVGRMLLWFSDAVRP